MNLFPQFLLQYFTAGIVDDRGFHLIDEAARRYASARILGAASSCMLVLAMLLNLLEGNHYLLLPLGSALLLILANFLLFLTATKNGLFSLIGTITTLLLLGLYLMVVRSTPDGSSLFWFLLLPPMLMLYLGIQCGTALYALLYTFFLLLFCTPLEQYLAYDYPNSMRARFLLALVGSYIFSFLAELVHVTTHRAFMQATKMLERHALTDPLTALGNRRDFQNYFTTNQAQAIRLNRAFSIAMVDIDFFKRVNDTHGHQIGDFVLCHLAAILTSQLRMADRLFRWGGEEFVILMPDTNLEEARIVAERLRGEVEKTPYIMNGASPIELTISIGLYDGDFADSMVKQISGADENLYKAKNLGRNRVHG